MERYTATLPDGTFYLWSDDGCTDEAITRLGLFENAYEKLVGDQEQLSAELSRLRYEGKKNSARFRELMGKKLIASNTLAMFKLYGLE